MNRLESILKELENEIIDADAIADELIKDIPHVDEEDEND